MNTIETLDPTPFRHLIMTIGELPSSFVDSMSYYEMLAWLCNYVEKNVVTAINNNAAAVEEIQQWIETLDLQDEVDNKLDEMAEDGTLAELISTEILGDLSTLHTTDKSSIVAAVNEVCDDTDTNTTDIQTLNTFNEYTNEPLRYSKLDISSIIPQLDFNLYRKIDGSVTSDFNYGLYYATSSQYLLYVDRDNGSDSTGDGSSATPFKTIKKAIATANSGDANTYRIICKSYRFYRDEVTTSDYNAFTDLSKNIIIEPDDLSKTIFVAAEQPLTWTQEEGSTYKATRSNVSYILNTAKGKNGYGVYQKIKKCETLDECKNTTDSWFQSGSTVYLHTQTGNAPDLRYSVVIGVAAIQFNLNHSKFLRLRNFDIYTDISCRFYNNGSEYENRLILENVNISYCSNDNGFNINNIKYVVAKNCTTVGNQRDGFNYHYTSMPSYLVHEGYVYEENCSSYDNGIGDENSNNNCSTIHEGGNIVRVNGIYQTSKGPVIADVDSSTTYMSHCKVYQGLSAQHQFNFQNVSGSTGHAVLCDIEAMGGSVAFSGTEGFDVKLKNFKGDYTSNSLSISHYTE